MRSRLLPAAGIAATALLIAGCGSGSSAKAGHHQTSKSQTASSNTQSSTASAQSSSSSSSQTKSSGGTTSASSGTIVYALSAQVSPNWFFPARALVADSVVNSEVLHTMYKPLITFTKHDTLDYKQSLAQKITWNKNGTMYTIKLNPKWHWSNGTPVTSKDVVFMWDVMKAASAHGKKKLPWGYAGAGDGGVPKLWKSVVAKGPNTVVVTLNKPSNQQWFVRDGLGQITPVPASVWNKDPNDMMKELAFIKSVANDPSASVYKVVDGPFKFQSYQANQFWKFVPNKKYDGHKASISKLIFQYEASPTAEFAAVKAGTVNVGYLPTSMYNDRTQLTNDVFWPSYHLGFNYILETFNKKAPGDIGAAFSQLPVRQALQMGVDQQSMIKDFYHGYAVASYGPIAAKPATPFFDPALKKNPYPFNPKAGKALLKKNGWHLVHGVMTKGKLKLDFTIDYVSGNTTASHQVQLLQQDWAKEGIKVHLVPQQFNTVIADSPANASKWQVIFWGGGWYYGAYPAGGPLWGTGAPENSGAYSNKQMDHLIKLTNEPGTKAQLQQRFYNYEEYAAKQLPGIYLPWPAHFNEHAKNVHGMQATFNPFGGIEPNYWTVSH